MNMDSSKLHKLLATDQEIFLPWNTPSYLPLNGFHPLLRRILPKRDYGVPNLHRVCSSGELKKILAKSRMDLASDWENYSSFQSGYISWEKKLLSRIRMTTEVHHTRVPNTDSSYVLHFEDPKTLFFPHGGAEDNLKIPSSIDIDKLFSSQNKQVFSHVKESATELNSYLRNQYGSDLDIEVCELNLQNKGSSAIKTIHPSIVFNNSLNQSLENFVLRGGIILLNSLPELFKRHKNLQVTILGSIPPIHDLQTFGLTESAVGELNKITFYSKFLSQRLIDSILERSWMYVLISLNLHTDSVFRALENECYVITSNPHGLKNLLLPYSKKVFQLESMHTSLKYNNLGFAYNCQSSYLANSAAAEVELVQIISNYIMNLPKSSNAHLNSMQTTNIVSKDSPFKKSFSDSNGFVRKVTPRDWELEITPVPIFDMGIEKIFRWRDFYFFDKNPPTQNLINRYSTTPSELLRNLNHRTYFGHASFLNFALSKILKVIKIRNYEMIALELQDFTWKQTRELIRKRLTNVS